MKISIRYFSGTGNSWRLANACADKFRSMGHEAEAASIRVGGPPDPAAEAVCFCFPVYSLDLPRIVTSYLGSLPRPSLPVPSILIVSGGSPDNCGWAVTTGARLLAERGYPVRIGDLIQMPDNWTPFHSAPAPEESARIVAHGIRAAETIVERYLAGEAWIKPIVLRQFGRVGSMLMRTLFHKRGVKKMWMFFTTNADCKACGLCARQCPTGSISMRDGKPVWSDTCEQCMRCYNYCPTRAILQLDGLLHGSQHRVHQLPGFDPLSDHKAANRANG